MEQRINIAELLKDCPKGMELYSPLCGKCVFDRLNFGTIICKKQNTQEITFTSKGHYMLPVFDDCECMIFPSKDQRDWSKFVPPCEFKDGDVLVHTQNGRFIMSIYKSNENEKLINTHAIFWDREEGLSVGMQICCYTDNVRFATKEEKAKLFDVIKANGYKWNPENKTLEKLIRPKFKTGDKIVKKGGIRVPILITGVGDTYYWSTTENSTEVLSIAEQDDWELVPTKFDITTLVPFESKVLVRDSVEGTWFPCFFGGLANNNHYPYRVIGGEIWKYCIPYEGNEHLSGKKEDCSEYYKNW